LNICIFFHCVNMMALHSYAHTATHFRLLQNEEYVKQNGSPYCKDESSFEWDINDATHII